MHPQAEQKSNFRKLEEIWTVGAVNLVDLACVLRATAKKGRQLFRERKVHLLPVEKILATPDSRL